MLAQSEQMRKEADDTGPMAELEHWKMRMAKFSSLVEQINHQDCRAVLRILHIAKSKTLKVTLLMRWSLPLNTSIVRRHDFISIFMLSLTITC